MQFSENFLQKLKIILHAIQGLIVFLAWAITIAIFTKPGSTDGRTKFFFALCWFTIPLLIYQAAIPQFIRTKRFSNAYAHVVIDVLLAIFWFAAFISVATWTNEGIKKGVARPGNKGCDAFAFGGEGKCNLSQATIGMGLGKENFADALWWSDSLLFLATSAISIRNAIYFRRNGSLPGTTTQAAHPLPTTDEDDQAKYAFSSNPHDELDEHEDAEASGSGVHGGTNYELLHDSGGNDALYPPGNRPWQSNSNNHSTSNLGHYDEDTSYHSTTAATTTAAPPQLPPHRDPVRDRDPSPYRVHNPPPPPPLGHETGRYDRPDDVGAGGDPFADDLAMSHDHGGYGKPGAVAGGRVEFPQGDYGRTGLFERRD
ncbi:MAG: hypothetical protein L6R37_003846 [Teloschistes peruensis]|nr:MAG: hypothetical protein L6R37_003846 [Teloschistes peruensis]